MTLEQTRQLGIEFERRIQAIMPSEELFNKLDTDTIYAYLNEYQMSYIHDIYRNLDKLEPGTTITAHVESVLQSMMTSATLRVGKKIPAKEWYTITTEDGFIFNDGSFSKTIDPNTHFGSEDIKINLTVNGVSGLALFGYTVEFDKYKDNDVVAHISIGIFGTNIKTADNTFFTDTYLPFVNQTDFDTVKVTIKKSTGEMASTDTISLNVVIKETTDFIEYSPDYLTNKYNDSTWNDIINDCGRSMTWKLPSNYYMYIRSVSNISKTFSWITNSRLKTNVIPNIYTKQTDVWKVLETPHNSLRILRYPVVVLSQYYRNENGDNRMPTITIIYDRYTEIEGIKVIYYKQPQYFSLMTSTPCELPMDVFDDIVNGAVQLYLNYSGGYIKEQKEAAKKAREKANKENRQSDSNED